MFSLKFQLATLNIIHSQIVHFNRISKIIKGTVQVKQHFVGIQRVRSATIKYLPSSLG